MLRFWFGDLAVKRSRFQGEKCLMGFLIYVSCSLFNSGMIGSL